MVHWRSKWLVLQSVFHIGVIVHLKLKGHISCLLDTTFVTFLLLWFAISALIFCDVFYTIVGQALGRLLIVVDLMDLDASSDFLGVIQ